MTSDVQSDPIPTSVETSAPFAKAGPAMTGGASPVGATPGQNFFPCENPKGCGRSFGGYRAYRDAHYRGKCRTKTKADLRKLGLHERAGVWSRKDPTNSQPHLPGMTRRDSINAAPSGAAS